MTPTAFPYFSKLLPELRVQIWRELVSCRVFLRKHAQVKITLRRAQENLALMNTCRESRQEALRLSKSASEKQNRTTFDAAHDILCLSHSDALLMSYSDNYYQSIRRKPCYLDEQVFGYDLRPVLERIEIVDDVQVVTGGKSEYGQFTEVVMAVLRRFPAIREIRVRRLRSDRLSMKTGVWGVAKGIEEICYYAQTYGTEGQD